MRLVYSLLILVLVVSCQQVPVLEGKITGASFDKIYLYKVLNQRRQQFEVVDSAIIRNGHFQLEFDSFSAQLYFLGNNKLGQICFLEGGNVKAHGEIVKNDDGKDVLQWQITGDRLQERYLNYQEEKETIGRKSEIDSLSREFYAARKLNDRDRMKEVKAQQLKVMESVKEPVRQLITHTIEANMDNAFGMYLYLQKRFLSYNHDTDEQIIEAHERINRFGPSARNSYYADQMREDLERFSACAIGHKAPEISGMDTTGLVRSLADFKGKYVIVDFWSSGCRWCRYETPNLLKAYNAFKDQGFTVLGVSSDWKKEPWKEAIHEDKSHWDQILLNRKEISPTMNRYCISGIPHIILVGPDGTILEKELRGEAIYDAVAKHMN